jgi:hypothetical protein
MMDGVQNSSQACIDAERLVIINAVFSSFFLVPCYAVFFFFSFLFFLSFFKMYFVACCYILVSVLVRT